MTYFINRRFTFIGKIRDWFFGIAKLIVVDVVCIVIVDIVVVREFMLLISSYCLLNSGFESSFNSAVILFIIGEFWWLLLTWIFSLMFIFAFTNELFDSNLSRIIIVFLIFSVCDVGLVHIKWGNITVDLVLVDICVCVVCVSGGDCVFKL